MSWKNKTKKQRSTEFQLQTSTRARNHHSRWADYAMVGMYRQYKANHYMLLLSVLGLGSTVFIVLGRAPHDCHDFLSIFWYLGLILAQTNQPIRCSKWSQSEKQTKTDQLQLCTPTEQKCTRTDIFAFCIPKMVSTDPLTILAWNLMDIAWPNDDTES